MKSLLTIVVLLCAILPAFAQETEKDKVRELERQREFQKNRIIEARMDSAIALLNAGNYELADAKLRSVLASVKSVPSELVYYFGKNSYYLEKYKQSVDWLTKYIQLKGTTGQFSQDASIWLKKAEDALVQQRLAQSAKAVEVLSRDYTIDCGSTGKVTCPVCNGSTVVIRKDYFGEKYSTCGYCNKLGYLSCEDYNKLLRGELKAATDKK